MTSLDCWREDRQSGQLCSSLFQVVTWKKKICSFCHFSLQNSFAVSKFRAAGDVEEDGQEKPRWCIIRPRGKLICAVFLFYYTLLFTAAHCFRSLPGQLTVITNKTLKGGRAGSASRLDSSLFEEGWGERGFFFYFLKKISGGGGKQVCAAPKGMLFAPFWSINGYRLCLFWAGIGFGFRGS